MNTKILLLATSLVSASIYADDFPDEISIKDQLSNTVREFCEYMKHSKSVMQRRGDKIKKYYDGLYPIEKVFFAGELMESLPVPQIPDNDNDTNQLKKALYRDINKE